MYVFDTNIFIILFTYYYPSRFPTLWNSFNDLINEDRIISTRENFREIDSNLNGFSEWSKQNDKMFHITTAEEAEFIKGIYKIEHFQQNIEQQKMYKGGFNADPFIIAKAAIISAQVVTDEREKPNAVKIPNICKHFSIPCMNFEEFMEAENWSF